MIRKLTEKFLSVAMLLIAASVFVVIGCQTSTAQTSNESSTLPSASPSPTVEISREDADRCANNTRELMAARDELKAYAAEIAARDKRDVVSERLPAAYEKAIGALNTVIAAQDNLSADKNELIKAQTDLIKTLMSQTKNKSSPLKAILGGIAGILIGRGLQ